MSHVFQWIVVVPPLLVLAVAFATRNVLTALLTGIISAGLLATYFSPSATLTLITERFLQETHITNIFTGGPLDHLYTLTFLLILGIIIALITHSGGIIAYTQYIQPKIQSARAAQTLSLLLSCCFFIDDYLNSLVIGSIMRPITDQFKIPRVKLAFLLSAMSAPLCVLIPASSWVAMILVNLQASGVTDNPNATRALAIQADPLYVYLHTLPYLFYPIFLIMSAWLIVRRNISYASMHNQEHIAQSTGNLFGGKQPISTTKEQPLVQDQSLFDFFAPMGTFIATVILILLYTGDWHLFGGTQSLLSALQTANIFLSLLVASSVTLTLTLALAALRKKIVFSTLKHLVIDGWQLMRNSLLVLLLAWTLGSILQHDLKTGHYVAQALLSTLPTALLPVAVFVTSLLVSASVGSAWGTIVIIMPLIIPTIAFTAGTPTQAPLLLHQVALLYPVLASVLSGAIAGGHMSPISDATVVTATSASCYHLDHVSTQLYYIAPALVGTIVACLCTGFLYTYSPVVLLGLSFTIGLTVTISLLFLFNRFLKSSSSLD
jgi:tetracycline resistance efflux pump